MCSMDILKTVTNMLDNGGRTDSPVGAIVHMISQREGGLSGLVAQFQQSGLGDVVNSWIGTGQNLPVSTQQLNGIFSNDQLAQFAKMLGTNIGTAQSHLTELLPQVIDKLSPQGVLPEDDNWMSRAGGLLTGLLQR